MKSSYPRTLLPIGALLVTGLSVWQMSDRSPAGSGKVVVPEAQDTPASGSLAAGSDHTEGESSSVAKGAKEALMDTARHLGGRPSAPALWNRLDQPRVLATEDTVAPDGRIRRTTLVQVQGKYSNLVFEGMLPSGKKDADNTELTGALAKVADHLVVRPATGVTTEEFRAAMSAAGLTARESLSPDGGWLVALPAASLHGVDDAIAKLTADKRVAYAEPDYLVHASDIPGEDVALEMVDGQLVRSDSLLPLDAAEAAAAPVSDPATLAEEQQQRLQSLPAGARVIGFDAPYFLGGPSSYSPYLEEQNFVVSTAQYTYVQGAYTSGYPNNGSYYLRSLGYSDNVALRHRENLPFAMLSVDLAEYSTNFARATSVTFTGTKAGGGDGEPDLHHRRHHRWHRPGGGFPTLHFQFELYESEQCGGQWWWLHDRQHRSARGWSGKLPSSISGAAPAL
ncbi:MAG: hypothetical protein QM755_19330 [Luteolibacter sp.]